jgi:hypothetical protein
MTFFAQRLLLIAIAAVVAIVLVGMYSEWHACSAAGGTTVRGLFKLECINPKPPNNQIQRAR